MSVDRSALELRQKALPPIPMRQASIQHSSPPEKQKSKLVEISKLISHVLGSLDWDESSEEERDTFSQQVRGCTRSAPTIVLDADSDDDNEESELTES